ncbi:MAG TPA: flavin reductase family protein [Gaiellaceae bacterium]|nr:flavin reductase family protein [Gaiellaceae bacterium]
MAEAGKPSEAMVSAFRGCVGEFATGVAVVTSEHEEVPAGMTLNSFTSVSLEPLLVLVSLGTGSRTLHATRSSGRFALSVLAREQRDVALEFSQPWGAFPLGHVSLDREGFLPVTDAVAVLRCRVERIEEAGDHALVLGEVTSITHGGGEPLVFHRGRFGGFDVDATVPAGHPIGIDEGSGW